jgi:hypothetical protein
MEAQHMRFISAPLRCIGIAVFKIPLTIAQIQRIVLASVP